MGGPETMFHLIILLMVLPQIKAFWLGEDPAVSPENPFVFVGDNLTLTCKSTQGGIDGHVAGNMYFKLHDTVLSHKYLTILDNRSIQLTYPVQSRDDDGSYTCYLNNTVLGQQMVTAEYRPLPVEVLRVLVDDWRSMLVSWDVGRHWIHPDLVDSRLMWSIKDSYWSCPGILHNNTDTCVWKAHDGRNSFKNVPYQMKITVVVSDKSKREMTRSESQWFYIDTKLHVKPAAIVDLTVVNVTSSCLCLSWHQTKHSSIRQIQHCVNVSYQQQLQQRSVTHGTELCVCKLNSYTEYKVSVSAVPLINNTPVGYYSDSVSLTVSTTQGVPTAAPMTTLGSFHITHEDTNMCKLTIYWQKVPENETNGEITAYNIQLTDTETQEIVIHDVPGTKMSWETIVKSDRGYIVKISASTEAGTSQKHAVLHIPKETNRPSYPNHILVEGEGKLLYVSWRDPQELKVANYTLFYCNASTSTQTCSEVKWTHLLANQTSYILPMENPDKLLVGVSVQVNQQNGHVSSGIVWEMCTYSRNKKPVKPENLAFSPSQPNMALRVVWDKSACGMGGPYILYYILQYCQGHILSCTGTTMTETIANSAQSHLIKHLEVGVSYRVTLRGMSRAGPGPESDPISAVVIDKGHSSIHLAFIFVPTVLACVFLIVGIFCCCRRMQRGIKTFKLPIDMPKSDYVSIE